MSNDLSTEVAKDLIFEPENLTKETIKKYLCPKATDQELMVGLQVCKTMKLNPLKREVYLIKYSDNPEEKIQIVTGYEVYLKRAERSGKYMGMRNFTKGSIKEGNLKGCVEVYRKGWDKPLYHEVEYSEYVQKKKDGTITKFWAGKPKTMIKKVAIAQGFRLAFPDELDGMPYIDAEIEEENPVENTNGKSRVENIIENQIQEADIVKEDKNEEIKPETKEKQSKESKKTTKKEDTKSNSESTDGKPTPSKLPEGHHLIQGIITDPPTYAEIGADKKPKWVFKMGDLKLGTFDKLVFEGICAICDLGKETPILMNIEYKERQSGEKTLRDIVKFSQATTAQMPI